MAKKINEIVFSTDEDIVKNSVGEVTQLTDIWMRGNNTRLMRGGLYDPYIFGRTGKCKCGLVTEGYCNSCRMSVFNEDEYKSNQAYYSLANCFITEDKMNSLYEKFDIIGFEIPEFNKNKLISLWSTVFIFEDKNIDKLTDAIFGEVESEVKSTRVELEDENGKNCTLIIKELEESDSIEYVGPNGLSRLSNYKFYI